MCAAGFGQNQDTYQVDKLVVGTVIEVGKKLDLIKVEQIWLGDHIAPEIQVRISGARGPFAHSEDDAILIAGNRYLIGLGSDFSTSICTVSLYSNVNPQLIPHKVTSPQVDGEVGAHQSHEEKIFDNIWLILVGLIGLIAIFIYSTFVRRRINAE
jgi:hypothetical protein